MQDTTVSRTPCASDSSAMLRCNVRVKPVDWGNEDEVLARVLITSWTPATGRALRMGVPPHSHGAEELITFRADDQIAIP